jgi:hypothetical protein
VLLASVAAGPFETFYRTLRAEAGDAVALLRLDGTLRAKRVLGRGSTIALHVPAG